MEFTLRCHYYNNCQFYFRKVTVSARLRASRGEREESGALHLLDPTHTAVIQSSLHQMPTPSQYEALQFKGSCHELKVEKTVAAFSTLKFRSRPTKKGTSYPNLVSKGTWMMIMTSFEISTPPHPLWGGGSSVCQGLGLKVDGSQFKPCYR